MEDVLLEFKSCNDKQSQTYHTDQNSLYSTFRPSDPKFAWSTPGLKELDFNTDVQIENGGLIGNYIVSDKFDILKTAILKAHLPKIEVDPKYKDKVVICWCKNIGHNIIKDCTISCKAFNEKVINPKWLDMNYIYFVNNKEYYLHLIGNRDELIRWADNIEGSSIAFPLPLFNRNEAFAFPIFRLRKLGDVLSFKFVYNLKITKLIRMKILNDEGKWTNIEPKMKYLLNTEKYIKLPKIFGSYVKLSNFDMENRLSIPYKCILENIVSIKSDTTNITENGRTISIPIESPYPVKAIFVCVVNNTKEKINLHSEYFIKVNHKGTIKKVDPIKHISLRYNDNNRTIKFSKRESIMSEVMEYLDLGKNFELSKKYGMTYISLSPDFVNFHNGTGIVLEKDTKAVIDIRFDKYCIGTPFIVELFLFRVKKLTIDNQINSNQINLR